LFRLPSFSVSNHSPGDKGEAEKDKKADRRGERGDRHKEKETNIKAHKPFNCGSFMTVEPQIYTNNTELHLNLDHDGIQRGQNTH